MISVEMCIRDRASYDENNAKAYVLEKGDYVISINSDSHTVLDQKTYTADKDVVYKGENKRASEMCIRDRSIAALLQGDNLLLSGVKATGKIVLCETLAWIFGRPEYDISFHVNTDSADPVSYTHLKVENKRQMCALKLHTLWSPLKKDGYIGIVGYFESI